MIAQRRWSALSCAALFLAAGCGSGGNADPFQSPSAITRVRPIDNDWLGSVSIKPTCGGESIDASGLAGHWFIDKDKARYDLALVSEGGRLSGTFGPEGAIIAAQPIEHITWDRAAGQLRFRVQQDGRVFWFATDVTDGVMTGRYAVVEGDHGGPTSWAAYSGHLMGWRSESFNQDIVPRVFDVVIDDGRFARLRLDRSATDATQFTGELKTKATAAVGSDGELPAQPLIVRRWDGEQLVFDTTNGTTRQRFTAMVSGRNIEGSMVQDSATPVPFSGTRANILSYGLRAKTGESRRDWQERARRILFHLMMSGNPAPLSTSATVAERPLLKSDSVAPDRDDDSSRWQQQYRLSDVTLDHLLPNRYGSEPLARRMHGLLAVPAAPPPPEGYPVVLSLNGHYSSAQQQLTPDGTWYGDAYARRGYVVLAIDISHRPPSESGGLYGDPADGDSPETGNHAHPAIASPGLDSDWADDGERAWDAMRGIDFLVAQEHVNAAGIIVTGLSMGAEVTQIVAAMDARVTIAVAASAPPDLSMMALHGNHPCWQWTHGDATEFVEMSDFLSMIAPRQVILESGKDDWTYSSYSTPYAVEKENAWRARIGYGDDATKFVHYLHPGGHQYRVGDSSDESPDPGYIQVPQLIGPSELRKRFIEWQVDGQTVSLDATLFDYLAR